MQKTVSDILGSSIRLTAVVDVQIARVTQRATGNGKPFFDVSAADSTGSMGLKFWSDTPAFDVIHANPEGGFYRLKADFSKNNFGVDASGASLEPLSAAGREALLAGGGGSLASGAADWDFVVKTLEAFTVEPLRVLCLAFVNDSSFSSRFKRAAAAVKNHHAVRGGLLTHTASMMRAASAIAPLYPNVVPDLLLAGAFFHDAGKIFENDTGMGFAAEKHRSGELLGHITIGVEIVNRRWRDCADANPKAFEGSEVVRDHLLHLIVSHHGTKEFGSPQTPRTPEAWLLHYIDNMDAHMEQVRAAYANLGGSEKGFFESPTLRTTLIAPLLWSVRPDQQTQAF